MGHESVNSATGEVIAEYATLGAAQAAEAIGTADAAWGERIARERQDRVGALRSRRRAGDP